MQADPARVGALDLLTDSERRWSSDLPAALWSVTTDSERHRKRLVREALTAYLDLLGDGPSRSDPLAPLLWWPACTVVALADLAAESDDHASFVNALGARPRVWLDGWVACSAEMRAAIPPDAPGVTHLHAAAGTVDASSRPEFRLHIETGALSIVYPGAVGSGYRVEAGGGACPSIDDRWVIPRPVPAVTCFDVLGNVERVAIVDIHDPMLVFDSDGQVIARGSALPTDEVWLVHLGKPSQECFQGSAQIIEVAAPPVGWSRWWLGRVSLSGVTALRSVVGIDDHARRGPWRMVASADHADLELGEPLGGVTDSDGDVVYGDAPRLRLPAGGDTEWTIEVRRNGSASGHHWSAHPGATVALGTKLTPPILGRYEVHAHAPGCRPVSAGFTVAHGLTTTANMQVRPLSADGLWPARIVLRAPRGVHPVPGTVKLGPTDVSRPVRVHVAGQEWFVDLHVGLPHCAIRRRTGGANETWEVTARQFTLDDAIAGGALDVRLPRVIVDSIGVPDILAATKPDDPSGQRIPGRRVTTDVYRYPLASLIDSVRSRGSMALWLMVPENAVQVGTLHGVELATGVRALGGELQLDGLRRETVRIQVRAALSPWIEAFTTELPPTTNRIALPTGLNGRALQVTVESADDLDGHRRRHHFHVDGASSLPNSDSWAAQVMSEYLAGRSDVPTGDDALPLVWFAAARSSTTDPELGRLTAHECATQLGRTPLRSLVAVCGTGLTTAELAEPIVRSGLAEAAVRQVADPRHLASLWANNPLPVLLLSSPLIPYLSGSPRWDLAELDEAESILLSMIEAKSSPAHLALLRADRPPAPEPAPDETAAETVAEAAMAMLEYGRTSRAASLFDAVGRSAAADQRVSAGLLGFALTARLAAQSDGDAVQAANQQKHAWVELARRFPHHTVRALITAEFAVAGWYARHA